MFTVEITRRSKSLKLRQISRLGVATSNVDGMPHSLPLYSMKGLYKQDTLTFLTYQPNIIVSFSAVGENTSTCICPIPTFSTTPFCGPERSSTFSNGQRVLTSNSSPKHALLLIFTMLMHYTPSVRIISLSYTLPQLLIM
jgi:hypothetical protein